MTRARMLAALAAAVLVAAGVAGCGSTAAPGAPAPGPPALPAPLQTSFANGTGPSWAIVEMGGSAAQEENFWEMFARPPGTTAWHEVTPEGVADNGGLVVTGSGGPALLTGFVPSQGLTFSPLATSSDSGSSWTPGNPVNPGLAAAPDALAAGPGDSLLALTSGGAELSQDLGAAWRHLSSTRALAATPAGRACAVTGLTAVAFGSAGTPMLAAGCGRPAVAGIFAETAGSWHAAGPSVPASLARQDIEVLRLAAVGSSLVALLQAGTGPGSTLTAAWYAGGRWTLSSPLRTGGPVRSTAVGPGGSVGIILNATRAATLAGPGASWQALPALPRYAATLALGPAGQVDAIAAHLGTFADYRRGASGWSLAQTLHVTIPYGTSS
jgi:hypothetical protein